MQKEELAKELQMIESAIRDREREIMVNHMRIVASGKTEEKALLSTSKGKGTQGLVLS